MPYLETTATRKVKALNKRLRLIAGGTSASKTISVLLYLIAKAMTDYDCTECGKHGCLDKTHSAKWGMKPTLTSVVSESFPHLRRGAMRDFLNIMQEHGYFKDDLWSKTDYTYTFETGSKLEFFSADQPSKVRGPRRDRLFCNEVNNIDQESWEQLLIRTKEFAIADWNPVTEFFMYTDYIGIREDADFIVLTYKDNEALSPDIVSEIESRRHNKNWWRVYGEGLLGEVEGRIYTNWQLLDDIPHEARLERRGMDFGYSNDPTALVDIYYYNGGYILDERLYRKGLHNKDIADFINNLESPMTLVVADSAEPKSIDEIRLHGVNILPARKVKDINYPGKSYLKQSIDYVQDQKISVTKRSVNLIKEYRSYLWQTDKEGRIINEPEGGNDHALDAVRYGMESLKPQVKKKSTSSGNVTSLWH